MYGRDYEPRGYSRERKFEHGQRHLANLARAIETATDCSLDSRRALDFGCGVGRLAIPLAQRCEHVYGLDLSPAVLREADENAKRLNVANVEWVESSRLSELSGRYDLVLSVGVFQHIPARQGEQLVSMLVQGLQPGGVGVIVLILRPTRPLAGLLNWLRDMRSAPQPKRKSRFSGANPVKAVRGWDWSYPYMFRRSYSLNRLAEVLAEAGIKRWTVRFNPGSRARSFDTAQIIFRKPPARVAVAQHSNGAQADEPNG